MAKLEKSAEHLAAECTLKPNSASKTVSKMMHLLPRDWARHMLYAYRQATSKN